LVAQTVKRPHPVPRSTAKCNETRKETKMFDRLIIVWRPFWLSGSILAVAACAYQGPSPPPPAAATAPPAATTYFDGTYIGGFTQNVSAPGSNCPNFPAAPALTINNGVARFAALDITYQGYVTSDGAVNMQSPEGRTFVGQIDPYYVLRGQTTGACVYNAVWQRKGAGQGPKPGT
jgi:hypothetical protein